MAKNNASAASKQNIVKERMKDLFKKGHFYPFRKWWWRDVKNIFWDAKNRFFYGYSDRDWYDWDYEFATRNIELFRQLKDKRISYMHKYPASVCKRDKKLNAEFFNEDEQNEFFDTLIDCLEDMSDDGDTCARKIYGKNLYDCSDRERMHVGHVRQESINMFFDIVKERFGDFWD